MYQNGHAARRGLYRSRWTLGRTPQVSDDPAQSRHFLVISHQSHTDHTDNSAGHAMALMPCFNPAHRNAHPSKPNNPAVKTSLLRASAPTRVSPVFPRAYTVGSYSMIFRIWVLMCMMSGRGVIATRTRMDRYAFCLFHAFVWRQRTR